jgi:hypothetical protein
MKFMLRRIAIEDASTGQFFHRPMWIFVTAFLLRTAVMATFFAHSQFTWGVNESAGIARSIVEGHGFSSAFHDADGPTAWLAPVYPGLIAAIFRFLGIESVASAGVAVLFNVIFSSLTAAGGIFWKCRFLFTSYRRRNALSKGRGNCIFAGSEETYFKLRPF